MSELRRLATRAHALGRRAFSELDTLDTCCVGIEPWLHRIDVARTPLSTFNYADAAARPSGWMGRKRILNSMRDPRRFTIITKRFIVMRRKSALRIREKSLESMPVSA